MVSLLSCPKPHDGVIAREVEGEVLLLSLEQGQLHKLNVSASFVWRGCNGTQTVADIARQLADAYRLPRLQAEQDVLQAVTALVALGVVVVEF